MEGFIKFILIVLLIYFGIKLIFRFFGPMILRYIMKRVGKSISRKFQDAQNSAQSAHNREGDVTIEKKPKTKRKSNNDVGEYVDYEEID
ncbi:MAG TPA: DUF4834 family protein [Salinimicrobium sp.]|nr:DUF4834 family protein [Salinimicrobium sp.]